MQARVSVGRRSSDSAAQAVPRSPSAAACGRASGIQDPRDDAAPEGAPGVEQPVQACPGRGRAQAVTGSGTAGLDPRSSSTDSSAADPGPPRTAAAPCLAHAPARRRPRAAPADPRRCPGARGRGGASAAPPRRERTRPDPPSLTSSAVTRTSWGSRREGRPSRVPRDPTSTRASRCLSASTGSGRSRASPDAATAAPARRAGLGGRNSIHCPPCRRPHWTARQWPRRHPRREGPLPGRAPPGAPASTATKTPARHPDRRRPRRLGVAERLEVPDRLLPAQGVPGASTALAAWSTRPKKRSRAR